MELEDQKPIEIWEMIKMVATTRIAFPESVVRLSAGRTAMSMEGQALCFMAGASSIFAGDKLLTTPNPEYNADKEMFDILGLTPKAPFEDGIKPETKEDAILMEKEAKAAARKAEIEASKGKPAGFAPRKVTITD